MNSDCGFQDESITKMLDIPKTALVCVGFVVIEDPPNAGNLGFGLWDDEKKLPGVRLMVP